MSTGLARYHEKRDFRATPEPRGHVGRRKAKVLTYLIQKHAASHLHYDFRLELNGVLLSWAVPKGPSLDPGDRRLAMHVEDHPLEYGGFEGTIPKGQYGGGTVMLWDRGTWEPVGDPAEGYRKGHLKFDLRGQKLKGRWALVKMHGGKYGGGKSEPWLLIKDSDEAAAHGTRAHIVETEPDSVLTGRSIEQIAGGDSREWRSDRSVKANLKAGAVEKKEPASPKRAPTKKARTSAKSTTTSTTTAKTQPAGPGRITVAGVSLSHPDKLLFPEAGITKLSLARYYERVAGHMLPYVKNRPLSLVRCPDGWGGQCFYQKHAAEAVHEAVQRVQVPEGDHTATYLAADSLSALVGLAQWGVIELHPWGARAPHPDKPDVLIFDFDPADDVPWARLAQGVKMLKTLLDDLGLKSFLKTTGGKGLHVVVPVRPTLDWDEAKHFTRTVAELFAQTFPDRFTSTMSKAQRAGRIFIDYLRNAEGATAIAPYGVRARENAPVSTPIAWRELARDVRFDHFNVKTVPARLARQRLDPWKDFASTRQSVTRAMLDKLGAGATLRPVRKS